MAQLRLSRSNEKLARLLGYSAVYIIGCLENQSLPCKVGISNSPLARLKAIQAYNPAPLDFAEIIFIRTALDPVDAAAHRNVPWYLYDELDEKQLQKFRDMGEALRHSQIDARALEVSLHKMLKAKGLHHRGEWFNGGGDHIGYEARAYVKANYAGRDYLDMRSMLRKLKLMHEQAALAAPVRRARPKPAFKELRSFL